jgi:hypothetical protein
MIINQRLPTSFGPNITLSAILVTDTPSITSTIVNSGVIYQKFNTASFHYDYLLSGSNIGNSYVSYSSVSILSSSYPIIKRGVIDDPMAGRTKIRVSNGRAETSNINLNFLQTPSITTYSNPKSLIEGTYAKYSWDRVASIFSALDDGTPENHKVFNSNQTRRQISIIPHDSLTCHSVGDSIGGLNVVGGHLRAFAITRRHCLSIAHSGPGGATNYTIRFRGINNEVVDRTVIANINLGSGLGITIPPNFNGPRDVRLLVLNSDLPESVTPALYVGDWFYNYTGSATVGEYNPGAFGFISFNQDTHITPIQVVNPIPSKFIANYSWVLNNTAISGREFGINFYGGIKLEGFERWGWYEQGAVLGQWYPNRPFHHVTRSGDSGSPIFYPVSNGKWAIGAGIVSGSMWRPLAVNALIAQVNAGLGITGNYNVVVASDPMI